MKVIDYLPDDMYSTNDSNIIQFKKSKILTIYLSFTFLT